MASRLASFVLVLGILACHGRASPAPDLPPPPPHPHGQALWRIVHGECVPGEVATRQPAPCIAVDLSEGEARGYAVLKDLHGAEQFLVMPTAHVTGIEDPRLLQVQAPAYFVDAWSSRHFVEARIGKAMPRQDMAVSVNSLYGRSQDLLHLHVDCLTPEAKTAIAALVPRLGQNWSKSPITLNGHPYFALRLEGETPPADPFRLLADGMVGARQAMGAWTLVLAGAEVDGQPGFVLLANRADPVRLDFASGEELQDHECALARIG